MQPLVVGVDSSTQSTKVEARDLASGRVVAVGRAPHPATSPPVSEQDPDSWWEALLAACAELGERRRDVVALSVAGQQHGLVLLDGGGQVLRPAKLWNDSTSAPQAAALVERLGAAAWAAACGSVPVASFTITKLAWVAEHEPELLGRVARIMLPHDYLTWRLTGRAVTDRGDASGTGWFDPSSGAYRPELLELAIDGAGHLGPEQLPEVLGPTEAAGAIEAEAAAALALPAGVIVGPGSGDNMAAALGLGREPGDVAISLGTSGTVFAASPTPTADPSGAVAGFASASGQFLPLVCTLNATKVTERLAGWLGSNAVALAELAAGAYDDPGTVCLVPYLDGERTPNRPAATGSLFGLTSATTRQQLALAAHDGVLCSLLDGLDALRSVGATTGGRLFLVGGGARSSAYRQRCADLASTTVTVPAAEESVAAGAAVQAAAVAAGSSVAEVAARWRLGAGQQVAPARDGAPVRARYAEARDQGLLVARQR